MSGIEIDAESQEIRVSDDSAKGPSGNVATGSQPKFPAPPTQTADPLGVLGWVVASVSVLVGFVVIAATTLFDGQRIDNRGANSVIPEQIQFTRSQIKPIPKQIVERDSPSGQGDNTASIPQQSGLSDRNDALDGKEVRNAFLIEFGRALRVDQAANPKPSD